MGRRRDDRVYILTLETLYYLTLGFFFTHEVDAVKRHEWIAATTRL